MLILGSPDRSGMEQNSNILFLHRLAMLAHRLDETWKDWLCASTLQGTP